LQRARVMDQSYIQPSDTLKLYYSDIKLSTGRVDHRVGSGQDF